MINEYNLSSYYRANPYSQQGYLPDSAFRNRKPANFMVQIPQGESFFEPTGKKHYQNLSYKSSIAEDHMILHEKNEKLANYPAKNKDYFRSLNTVDIEGASTNTLISQAVKNRMKAQEELRQRQKYKKDEELRLRLQTLKKVDDEQKRLQAIAKMKRQKNDNYHDLQKRMKTDHSIQQQSSEVNQEHGKSLNRMNEEIYKKIRERKQSNQQQVERSNYQSYEEEDYNSKIQKLQRQTYLQKELLMRQQERRANINHSNYQSQPQQMNSYENKQRQMQKGNGFELNKRSEYQRNHNQGQYENSYHVDQQKKQINDRNPNQYNMQFKQNQNERILLRNGIQSYQNLQPYKYDQPQKTRNQTSTPVEQVRQKKSNHSKDQLCSLYEKNEQYLKNIQEPQYQQSNHDRSFEENKLVSGYQSRQQHRRFNPTFLSYGSPTVGYQRRF